MKLDRQIEALRATPARTWREARSKARTLTALEVQQGKRAARKWKPDPEWKLPF